MEAAEATRRRRGCGGVSEVTEAAGRRWQSQRPAGLVEGAGASTTAEVVEAAEAMRLRRRQGWWRRWRWCK